MMRLLALTLSLALFAACSAPAPAEPAPQSPAPPVLMGWGDLTSRALPQPDVTLSYGEMPAQVVDVWLPEGEGPFPVVFMVHGGCWQKAIADRTLMNYAAADLRGRGLAVWNIEYRGVDETGGGYPGTFLDVAGAADLLRTAGPGLGLDVQRVAGFGHSAGGHLVTWFSARGQIPAESPLFSHAPFVLAGVVNSGGLADLEASAPVTLASCLSDIQDALTGPPSPARPDVFSDTSPARLVPAPALQVSVNGSHDRIAPPQLGRGYTALVTDAGGRAEFHEIPETGHVELIAPGTAAFEAQASILLEMLGVP